MQKVLFLGNSYTYVNNLPLLVAGLAHFSGDSLFFDSNTPGGYTLGWQPIAHCSDNTSLAKIRSNEWDFVVLQEQSQIPAIPVLRDSCMYPASIALHDSVKLNHYCSRILFYMTWGRRFGGVQCFVPNYCSINFSSFDQMQNSVTTTYKGIADSLNDWIAPAGEAWRFVLNHSNMVLHDPDNSHPNLNGSYLTACVFYDCIFHNHSAGNPFTAGLLSDTALFLQQAADSIVFGYSQSWNLWQDIPKAGFTTTLTTDTLFTHNFSTNATTWHWKFGDGSTSAEFEPLHVYHTPGNYHVTLSACDTCRCDSAIKEVTVSLTGISGSVKPVFRLVDEGNQILMALSFSGDGTLLLLDATGRKVAEVFVRNEPVRITGIRPGLYLWEFLGKRTESGKILVR